MNYFEDILWRPTDTWVVALVSGQIALGVLPTLQASPKERVLQPDVHSARIP